MSMSTSHTPYVEVVAVSLIGEVHIASAEEVRAPRAIGIISAGSSRPIEARLHIGKGMAAWEDRVTLCGIYQAFQFLNRREPPPFSTTHRFIIGIVNSISPSSRCCIRGFFPHKPLNPPLLSGTKGVVTLRSPRPLR